MHIRSATLADAEAMCEIYNRQVSETTFTLDLVTRTVEEQRVWIEERSGGLRAIVAEVGGEVVGFASLSFYRNRPGYRGTVEDSVYVAPRAQGQGVGSALMAEIIETAKTHGFHTILARIIGPQDASLALHKRYGFEMIGIEREVGRKFGRWHDVALMQLLFD